MTPILKEKNALSTSRSIFRLENPRDDSDLTQRVEDTERSQSPGATARATDSNIATSHTPARWFVNRNQNGAKQHYNRANLVEKSGKTRPSTHDASEFSMRHSTPVKVTLKQLTTI